MNRKIDRTNLINFESADPGATVQRFPRLHFNPINRLIQAEISMIRWLISCGGHCHARWTFLLTGVTRVVLNETRSPFNCSWHCGCEFMMSLDVDDCGLESEIFGVWLCDRGCTLRFLATDILYSIHFILKLIN